MTPQEQLDSHEQRERIFFYLHDKAMEAQRVGNLERFGFYRDGLGLLMREWRVWEINSKRRRISERHPNER